MPNLSFLGHLSGILVGIAQVQGWLPLTPSESKLRNMDSSAPFITSRPSFVPTTSVEFEASNISLGECSVVERCRTIIFGRGDEANSNIRFGSTEEVPSWGQGQRLGGADPLIETVGEKGGISHVV